MSFTIPYQDKKKEHQHKLLILNDLMVGVVELESTTSTMSM
jgi:hypothetical protein